MRSQENHRLLSRPVRIHWAGWETDTLRLQQAGWSLSAQQDIQDGGFFVGMVHKELDIKGFTNKHHFNFFIHDQWEQEKILSSLHLVVAYMVSGRDLNIYTQQPISLLTPIDAMPQFTAAAPQRLEDLAIFAPNLARTQEIIIPEPSVAELMAQILSKQEPARQDFLKASVKLSHEVRQRQKVHAQLISLVA